MIPIIDCKGEKVGKYGEEILKAMEGIGFVYLKNIQTLPYSEVEKAIQLGDKFWNLDSATKEKYPRPKNYEKDGYTNSGYVAPGVEILNPSSKAEIREAYNITPHENEAQKMVFPDDIIPEFRTGMMNLFNQAHSLALEILQTLNEALDIQDKSYFVKNHSYIAKGQNATTLRLLHYPPLPDHIEPGTVRCGTHSDYGSITLLWQDNIGGLEVLNTNNEWVPAVPVEGAVLVNTGDLLESWTNGRIKATKHRVLVPKDKSSWKKERRSIAFFVHPDDDCLVQPLDGTKSEKYNPITSKQHLINMFSKTY